MTAPIRHTWKCPKCGKVQRTEIRISEAYHRCPKTATDIRFIYVSGPPPPNPDDPVIL